ncbi:unnamed protein product [Owenia fusiformis]|uniref:Uncharacterized protein n=1 Tax=Owenia fusiformis TaxID=6347 RepID=A0A8J1YA10_OWEFU|nr:unnamed protein product [Owenia fusiformis]
MEKPKSKVCTRALCEKLNRTKLATDDITPLKRCLDVWDLSFMGIGNSVGGGLYAVTGVVISQVAGPGAVLAYLLAGFAALLSAICYAELGSRFPSAGAAYTYTYVMNGELWAFMVGWVMIMEHLLAVAAIAKGWSATFNTISSGAIATGIQKNIGVVNMPWLANYPDFLAIVSVIIASLVACLVVNVSFKLLNNFFVGFNILALVFVIGFFLTFSEGKHWVNEDNGGFLPFGFHGVLSGAGMLFVLYGGFYNMATATEETIDPHINLPKATFISMAVVVIVHTLASTALTLILPYEMIDRRSPFVNAMITRGISWMMWILAPISLVSMMNALIGRMYGIARLTYAMASDGLLFRFLSTTHPKMQTPIVATATFGTIAAILAFIFDIELLANLLSLGTLIVFTLVAANTIVARYIPLEKMTVKMTLEDPNDEDPDEKKRIVITDPISGIGRVKRGLDGWPFTILMDCEPGHAVSLAVGLMAALMAGFSVMVVYFSREILAGYWWSVGFLIFFVSGIILCLLTVAAHEKNTSFKTFVVPLSPWLESLSMLINILLVVQMPPVAWIRLGIWGTIGLVIYITYGISNSRENRLPISHSHILITYNNAVEPAVPKMTENVKQQQPINKDTTRLQNKEF